MRVDGDARLGRTVGAHFGWPCEACLGWRRRFSEPRECASCSRMITVNARGYCRPCTRQASLVRLPHCSIDVAEACRNGHQLYFASMFRQKRPEPGPRPQRPLPRPGQYLVPTAAGAVRWGTRPGHRTPRRLPGPAAALDDVLADHAARHGWGRQLQAVTRSALRVLLTTQDTPRAPIRATAGRSRPARRLHAWSGPSGPAAGSRCRVRRARSRSGPATASEARSARRGRDGRA